MFHNANRTKYNTKIQTKQNTKIPKCKWKKMQMFHNTNRTKYNQNKIQKFKNENTTKYKTDILQMWQNVNETKCKHDKIKKPTYYKCDKMQIRQNATPKMQIRQKCK